MWLPPCFSAAALSSYAQEFRGSLSGRVIDQQQAVVPNAKILATGAETGARFQTVSNADGTYVLPFLPPGPYHLSAEAPGFKKYVNNNVRVTTNEREQIDIQLEVGSVDQSVTVSAEGSMLETATASTGQVINTRQIENHADQRPRAADAGAVRLWRDAQLRPEILPALRQFRTLRVSPWAALPDQSNELLIDGSPDTTRNLRVAYNPPPDAVQEIKVETFQSDAAYGHTGGGTVNVVMRGGHEPLHGSVYEFNQIKNFAATPFFTNKAGGKKSSLIYNQWGMTAGGPVWIPKIYQRQGQDVLVLRLRRHPRRLARSHQRDGADRGRAQRRFFRSC